MSAQDDGVPPPSQDPIPSSGGGVRAWFKKQRESSAAMRKTLKSYGVAALISYGICDAVTYSLSFLLAMRTYIAAGKVVTLATLPQVCLIMWCVPRVAEMFIFRGGIFSTVAGIYLTALFHVLHLRDNFCVWLWLSQGLQQLQPPPARRRRAGACAAGGQAHRHSVPPVCAATAELDAGARFAPAIVPCTTTTSSSLLNCAINVLYFAAVSWRFAFPPHV